MNDEEVLPKKRKSTFPKVQCLDCMCIGELRTSGTKVFLQPEEVLSTRSILTQKEDLKKPQAFKEKTKTFRLTKQ